MSRMVLILKAGNISTRDSAVRDEEDMLARGDCSGSAERCVSQEAREWAQSAAVKAATAEHPSPCATAATVAGPRRGSRREAPSVPASNEQVAPLASALQSLAPWTLSLT